MTTLSTDDVSALASQACDLAELADGWIRRVQRLPIESAEEHFRRDPEFAARLLSDFRERLSRCESTEDCEQLSQLMLSKAPPHIKGGLLELFEYVDATQYEFRSIQNLRLRKKSVATWTNSLPYHVEMLRCSNLSQQESRFLSAVEASGWFASECRDFVATAHIVGVRWWEMSVAELLQGCWRDRELSQQVLNPCINLRWLQRRIEHESQFALQSVMEDWELEAYLDTGGLPPDPWELTEEVWLTEQPISDSTRTERLAAGSSPQGPIGFEECRFDLLVDWDTFGVKREMDGRTVSIVISNEDEQIFFKEMIKNKGEISNVDAARMMDDSGSRKRVKSRLKAKLNGLSLSLQNGVWKMVEWDGT